MRLQAVKRVSLPQWLVLSILVFMFLFLFSHPAHAKNYNIGTVEGLYSACQNVVWQQNEDVYDERGYGLCFGYVRGVKNTYDVQRLAAGSNFKGNICYPNASWLEIIKVYIAWVDKNPKALSKNAWVGFVAAMKDAYSCGISGNAAKR
jgi:hypothetical protein